MKYLSKSKELLYLIKDIVQWANKGPSMNPDICKGYLEEYLRSLKSKFLKDDKRYIFISDMIGYFLPEHMISSCPDTAIVCIQDYCIKGIAREIMSHKDCQYTLIEATIIAYLFIAPISIQQLMWELPETMIYNYPKYWQDIEVYGGIPELAWPDYEEQVILKCVGNLSYDGFIMDDGMLHLISYDDNDQIIPWDGKNIDNTRIFS